MRTVKLQMQLSVDGFVAGPNGEMDWMVWDWDDALKNYVNDLTSPIDCILLGRNLAQGFIPHWDGLAANPETADDASRKFSSTQKIVFTRTMDAHAWQRTTLAKGKLAAEIQQLKSQPGGDIMVYGGGEFVSNLIREGLIDEYHFFINPSILGAGMPIFGGRISRLDLHLVHVKAFECGLVVQCYRPK